MRWESGRSGRFAGGASVFLRTGIKNEEISSHVRTFC